MIWVLLVAGILNVFVCLGGLYRSLAAKLVPPPRRQLARCRCGAMHERPHSLRFRLLRFLTLPTSGLAFLLVSPWHKARRILLLMEVETILLSQYVRGLIDDGDVETRIRRAAHELGLSDDELPPPALPGA